MLLCSYADPKKLPANQMAWMPLEGDDYKPYTPPPLEDLKKWDLAFRKKK